jgi:hypothetical protein
VYRSWIPICSKFDRGRERPASAAARQCGVAPAHVLSRG